MATRFASGVQDDVELALESRATQNESTPDAPLNTSGDETVSSAAADMDDDPSPPSMPDPNGATEAGRNSTDKCAQINDFSVQTKLGSPNMLGTNNQDFKNIL